MIRIEKFKKAKTEVDIGKIVEELASFGCSKSEVARIVGVDQRKLSGVYQERFNAGAAEIAMTIRQVQLEVAIQKKSVPMLIHLGKFYCNQAERYLPPDDDKLANDMEKKSTADLLELVKQGSGVEKTER